MNELTFADAFKQSQWREGREKRRGHLPSSLAGKVARRAWYAGSTATGTDNGGGGAGAAGGRARLPASQLSLPGCRLAGERRAALSLAGKQAGNGERKAGSE